MVLTLLVALCVAAVVGVLPGLFWVKCLCSSANLVERLTFSVALSITLLPTVALLQIRLLGTGVTLPVAIISVLVVFGSGLAVYLGFGPAKSQEEPICPLLASPGFPALAPLGAAFALVAAGGVSAATARAPAGLAPPLEWQQALTLLVAGLVALSGIMYLIGSRRSASEAPYSREEEAETRSRLTAGGSSVTPVLHYGLLSVVLLMVLLRSYWGPLRYDWPFPRGVDSYEHAVMVRMMISEGETGSFMLYPPGLHLFGAVFSRFSGLDPMDLFALLGPALLLLPALGCYVLGNRLWGWQCGVAAAFFAGVIVGGSLEYMSSARYPNLIAAQFLLVVAIALLLMLYRSPSVRNGLALAIVGSSVVLYHQVGGLYEATLLGVVVLLFVPYLLAHERRTGLALIAFLALLGTLSVLYAWSTYELPSLLFGLLTGSDTGQGGDAVSGAIGTRRPYPLSHLIDMTSQPVLWLGLLGAVLLLVTPSSRASLADPLARFTLLAWALLFFFGSRTTYSGFPDRFETDLSIPLALFAALAFVTVLRSLLQARGTAAMVVPSLAVVAVGTVLGLQTVTNLEDASAKVRPLDSAPPPEVAAAGRWLEENNTGGNIIATPTVERVPFRGVLALGEYTGMQSYLESRIERGRDIPPTGKEPLWDSLWVREHPGGERTRQIIEEYDVRYLVLDKDYASLGENYPGLGWRAFETRSNLYQVSFENESVVILSTRGG